MSEWVRELWSTRTPGQRVVLIVFIALACDGATTRYFASGIGEALAMIFMAVAGFGLGFYASHDERDSD